MSATDMLAVILALGVSMALIITSAIANARLTRSRDEWRSLAIQACRECGNTRSR